jgi:hypothetical protein
LFPDILLHVSLHGTVPMKVGAVLYIWDGRRFLISRYGSCETRRIENFEGNGGTWKHQYNLVKKQKELNQILKSI